MHESARRVRVSCLPLSLSSYQVVEVPHRQTGDRGSSPSKSTLKFFNYLFLYILKKSM